MTTREAPIRVRDYPPRLPHGKAKPEPFVRFSILPGFAPAFGGTIAYLSLMVLAPVAVLLLSPWREGPAAMLRLFTDARLHAALRLSFSAAAAAALINTVIGVAIAWVLTRYRFPLRGFVDALIEFPFALPTAVAGIALSALLSDNGWLGGLLAKIGVHLAYSPAGVFVAMLFVSLPFAVRQIQPVLAEIDPRVEEAAATLGAKPWQMFTRIILPALGPAAISGFSLAFARAVGEYGSVIFLAGNAPFVSEIAPLLIIVRLEAYDYSGAAAVGVAMLVLSFAILGGLNLLQTVLMRRGAR